jgi:hypothetical protein
MTALKHAQTCSATCRSRLHRLHHPSLVINKQCKYCNALFTTLQPTRLYCNAICRKRVRYLRDSQNLEEQIRKNLRCRINEAIRGRTKRPSIVVLLGCSMKQFFKIITLRFLPGMTWDNYGVKGWHIDHIVPLSAFDLSDPKQLKIACHYTNLQPLWAIDNLRKGDTNVSK